MITDEATPPTVYKYPVPITDAFSIEMPAPARVLHFGLDPAGEPCVWCLVCPGAEKTETRTFALIGTGNPMPADCGAWRHRGSVTHGRFVWHLFQTDLSAMFETFAKVF